MCEDLGNLAIPRAQITPGSKFNANTQTLGEQREEEMVSSSILCVLTTLKKKNEKSIKYFNKESLQHLFQYYLTTWAILHT